MSFKPGSKSKETLESWESLLKKTFSKDGLLNFVKPVDNPIHWIHLLEPFDHQVSAKRSGESRATSHMDLSGWPLIPFSKVQMLKCEKCCLEFCSPVNHRRHLRTIHRRGAATEKENARGLRLQLATFWDALSAEEAGRIVNVKYLVLEDLIGEKIAEALSSLLQQPSLLALPHAYVKSGATLLELVQGSSAKILPSSSEIFKIFDGSSEKTFPSFGLNVMHRYIFEGGAGKVGLEAKNLVSTLGLLVELNLVKAFIKNKDEEAQRCQTALVEEEEAFQRKQLQLQERKRLKKARQKDVKEKEHKLLASVKEPLSAVTDLSANEEPADANSCAGYEGESQSSPNACENLYCTLAREEGESGAHVMRSQDCEDDGQLTEPEGSNSSHLYSKDETSLVASGLKEYPVQSTTGCFLNLNVGGSEHENIECRATDPLNEFKRQGITGSGQFVFKEKHRNLTMQCPSGQHLHAPVEKLSWREMDGSAGLQKFPGPTTAHNMKEAMRFAGPVAFSEDFSATRVVGYQNRQFPGKFVRAGKYSMAATSRNAVWAKKASKVSETPDEGASEHTASADAHQSKVEVAAVDGFEDSVPISIVSTLSSPSSHGCAQQSSVAREDEAVCSLEKHSSATLTSDLGFGCQEDQAGDPSSSLSPEVVGSLVIGSVSVSLAECVAGRDHGDLSLKADNVTARTNVSEASEYDSAKSSHSVKKVEESLRVLHENGAASCLQYKEQGRTGKASKFPLESALEEKENQEHPLHVTGEAKSGRAVTGQAGSRGGRVRVWRPVLFASPYESEDMVNSTAPAALNAVVNHGSENSVLDSNKSDSSQNLGLDKQGRSISESDSNSCSHMATAKEKSERVVVQDLNVSASTFEAVCGFLSARWSAVVNASDTVVLALEDEEEGESQSKRLRKDTSGIEASMNLPLEMSKETPESKKSMRVWWKECCPESAMVADKHISGKRSGSHVAPRFNNYRYVPK